MGAGNLVAAAVVCAVLLVVSQAWFGRQAVRWRAQAGRPIPRLYSDLFAGVFWLFAVGACVFAGLAVVLAVH